MIWISNQGLFNTLQSIYFIEDRAKKYTKFRWFFGVWENLVFCFRDLLTFSHRKFKSKMSDFDAKLTIILAWILWKRIQITIQIVRSGIWCNCNQYCQKIIYKNQDTQWSAQIMFLHFFLTSSTKYYGIFALIFLKPREKRLLLAKKKIFF